MQTPGKRAGVIISFWERTAKKFYSFLQLRKGPFELPNGPIKRRLKLSGYWQFGNLKDAMRVLQLKVPLLFRYSVVYQKVQSSTGSTAILL